MLVSDMGSGGAERVAANLVNAWAARGDSVTLLVTYSGRGECFYQLTDNVNLIYLADEVEHSLSCVGENVLKCLAIGFEDDI